MKLKKLLAMLLALAMVFAFAACSKDDDDKDKKESEKKASDTVKEDEADSKKDADTPAEKEDDEEASSSKKTATVAPGQAEWEGYEGMAFMDFLEQGISSALGGEGEVSVTIGMGWDTDSFDDSSVDEPYSFTAEMTSDGETASMIFYMAMEDGVLVAHGADVVDPDGVAESGSAEETEELLSMFVDFV